MVILSTKTYKKLQNELETLRWDTTLWKQKYNEAKEAYDKMVKQYEVQKLTTTAVKMNYEDKMKTRDMEWFQKWSDEVQKRAAIANLLRKEMDRSLGLTSDEGEDEDDEETL